jgi:hypothetical protein
MSSRGSIVFCLALLGASCATPAVRHVDVPPRTSQGLDTRRLEPQTRPERGETGDDATDRWLSEQIQGRIVEERREEEARSNAEAHRQAVEREQREVRGRTIEREIYYGDPYDRGAYYGRYHAYPRRSYGFFPWNTVFYGGLGAVIGHQSGRRDRGLAIGAGLGLLLDTFRASRW